MSTNSVPISGLAELEKHLDDLVASPDTPLEPKLLDDIELQLNGQPASSLFPFLPLSFSLTSNLQIKYLPPRQQKQTSPPSSQSSSPR
ncbi:hypothetical protein CSAL01_06604 [Colletotrichum salicis]|uniref:Uncharacterized protein n=1 Tax=Colletotrichum salicis TaxID=1209931 RepID=A0A135V920_9PEZI|nr:hypothetical protein CSAL01_06604 [Colletotrichum salicis]